MSIARPTLCTLTALVLATVLGVSGVRADTSINIASSRTIARETQIAKQYADQHRYAEALTHYKKALSESIAVNGEQHYDTARYRNEVGIVYINMGKYEEARRFLIQAAETAGKVKEPDNDNPDSASIYRTLGFVLYRLGNHEKALDWYVKALTIYEKVLGADHPTVTALYDRVATLHQLLGEDDKAQENRQKAGTIRDDGNAETASVQRNDDLMPSRQANGENDHSTAVTYTNIAVAEAKSGNNQSALENLQKAVAIFERTVGKNHPHTAVAYTDMAWVFSRMHDYDKAGAWARKAMLVNEKVFGKEHPTTGTSYGNVAMTHMNRQQYGKAVSGYLKAYRIYLARFGDANPQTQSFKGKLERAYEQANKAIRNHKPFDDWLAESLIERQPKSRMEASNEG